MKRKNKFLYIILSAIFAITLLAGGVFAADLVYVTEDYNNIDTNILTLLDTTNYSYDIVFDSQIPNTNFSEYKLMIIDNGNFGNNALLIPVNEVNSIVLNTRHLEEWNWISGSESFITTIRPREVLVYDNESSIVKIEGLNENFYPYVDGAQGEDYKFYYLSKSRKASGLVTVVADDLSFLKFLGIYVVKNGAVIATVEKGAPLKNHNVSNARGVFFGFKKTYLWTDEVDQMFLNSIKWGIYGGDRDNDGFLSEFDCNDYDSEINPGVSEIAYDGIDQNCDGIDLRDVDGDGFDAEIVGGNDCNDEDYDYNIASEDLVKNCVNDAPVIDYIPKIYAYETENATLEIEAIDYEGDEITYSVNDPRFIQDSEQENRFYWQTGYTDEGNYEFEAMAEDEFGNNSTIIFKAYILNKNKAPELLMDIPEQVWNEDEQHTLNLSEYFTDLDEDNLYYLFGESSSNKNIVVSSIIEGVVTFTVKENWFGEDWVTFRVTDGGYDHMTYTNNITLRVLGVNDAPYMLKDSENIILWENQDYTLNLDDYFVDVDGDLNYTYTAENITFNKQGNLFTITPNTDWFGEEEFVIYGEDLDNKVSLNVNLEVQEIIFPSIESLGPENNAFFNDTRTIDFSFKVYDKITEEFSCDLIVNGEIVDTMSALNDAIENFSYSFGTDGIYTWRIDCENLQTNRNQTEERSFEISAPDFPILNHIGNKQVNENKTVSFTISGYDPDGEDVSFTVKNAPVGSVFVDNGDGTASFNWLTNYQSAGTYYLEFTVHDPTGLETSEKTAIRIVDVREPPKFSDAPRCTGEDLSGLVKIKIKEPDYNDDFEIGGKVNVEFEIENNFDDDLRFNYEVHLYDLIEEESLDNIDDRIKINEGKDEKIEIELEVPEDILDNEFGIYFYVESEDNYCNSDYVQINIERKKHDVRIDKISVVPNPVTPGENMRVVVNINNLGTSNEDAIVEIEIPGLGIADGTEEFEIEKYGEDDSEKKEFVIQVPSDFKEGNYNITARVIFDEEEGDDGMDEKTVNFDISGEGINPKNQDTGEVTNNLITLTTADGKTKVTGSTIQLTTPENNGKISKNSVGFDKPNNPLGGIATFLLIGIIVLVAIIFIIKIRR